MSWVRAGSTWWPTVFAAKWVLMVGWQHGSLPWVVMPWTVGFSRLCPCLMCGLQARPLPWGGLSFLSCTVRVWAGGCPRALPRPVSQPFPRPEVTLGWLISLSSEDGGKNCKLFVLQEKVRPIISLFVELSL